MRCLIVDDNAGFRDVASTLLERSGIAVVGVASNSVEALRFYRELRPDVALVDVELGEECGFDLAEQLCRAGSPAPPSVILTSTYAEQDLEEMIAVSPVAGFLPKVALSASAVRNMVAGTSPAGYGRGDHRASR